MADKFNKNNIDNANKGYKEVLKSISAIAMEHRKVKKLADEEYDSITNRLRQEAIGQAKRSTAQKASLRAMGQEANITRELQLIARGETESRKRQLGYLESANSAMNETVALEGELSMLGEEKLAFADDLADVEARIKALKVDNLGLSATERAEELKTLSLAQTQLKNAQDKAEVAKREKEIQEGMFSVFGKSKEEVQEMAESFKNMVANPMVALLAGAALLVGYFTKIAGSAMDLRNELGISSISALGLATNIEETATQFSMLGVSSDDVKNTVVALKDEFGGIDKITKSTLKGVVGLSAEFGISGQNAAVLLKQMEGISGASLETNINILESASQLAKAQGVAPADVLNDVAESTEMFAKFAKDGGENVLQAAINAKKLGVNMATVEKIVDSVMDIENSIASEMEASVLLGRQINLNKAREAFLAGDIATGQQEIVKQLGSSAEFNEMNYYQRQALAKSLGVEVAELSKMIANQDELNSMTDAQKAKTDLIAKAMETLGHFASNVKSSLKVFAPLILAFLSPLIIAAGVVGGIVSLFNMLIDFMNELNIAGIGLGDVLMFAAGAALLFRMNLFGGGAGGVIGKFTGGIKKMGAVVAGLVPSMGSFQAVTGGKGMQSIMGGAGGAGKMNVTSLLKGAAAMLIIAVSIGVLGLALQTFTGIDFGAVLKGLGVLVLFTAGVMALGMLISSGVGALVFGAGVLGILALGGALMVLGAGLMVVGAAMSMLVPNLEGISALATSFSQLGVSLITLAGGLALMTPFLPSLMVLSAFGAISGALGGGAGEGGGEDPLGAKLDATNQKLDQLIALYQEGGVVQMDGKRVGEVLGRQILKPSIA